MDTGLSAGDYAAMTPDLRIRAIEAACQAAYSDWTHKTAIQQDYWRGVMTNGIAAYEMAMWEDMMAWETDAFRYE